jgi:hypothetical protein
MRNGHGLRGMKVPKKGCGVGLRVLGNGLMGYGQEQHDGDHHGHHVPLNLARESVWKKKSN